jgi:hypothetical protein
MSCIGFSTRLQTFGRIWPMKLEQFAYYFVQINLTEQNIHRVDQSAKSGWFAGSSQ